MDINATHVIGAIFVAYIVVKEIFVLLKGETKDIAKKVNELHKLFIGDRKRSWDDVSDKIQHTEETIHSAAKKISDINNRIEDLWEWHNKEDQDGVKIWYIRSSLQSSLKDLAEAVNSIAELSRTVVKKAECMEGDLDNIKKDLKKDFTKEE